jgi:hypothetical protein
VGRQDDQKDPPRRRQRHCLICPNLPACYFLCAWLSKKEKGRKKQNFLLVWWSRKFRSVRLWSRMNFF